MAHGTESVAVSSRAALATKTGKTAASTWWHKVQAFWQSVGGDSFDGMTGVSSMVRVGGFFAAGFVLGLLFKRHLRWALICSILIIGVIMSLEQYDMLMVNWGAVKALFGLAPDATSQSAMTQGMHFLRVHIVAVIALVGGYLFGRQLAW